MTSELPSGSSALRYKCMRADIKIINQPAVVFRMNFNVLTTFFGGHRHLQLDSRQHWHHVAKGLCPSNRNLTPTRSTGVHRCLGLVLLHGQENHAVNYRSLV